MRLRPLALACGFGAAGLLAFLLLFVPLGLSMYGMHGYGMMAGGNPGGFGAGLALGLWATVLCAAFGAVVATVYNAVLSRTHRGEG